MGKRKPPFLRVLILAILIKEGKLHGYSLYKRILYHTCMKWKPSIGTVYRILNKMTEEGLVSKHTEGRRHYYAITPDGIKYFLKNSKTPLTRMAGVLTIVLEAYLKASDKGASTLTKDLRGRLGALKEVLQSHDI